MLIYSLHPLHHMENTKRKMRDTCDWSVGLREMLLLQGKRHQKATLAAATRDAPYTVFKSLISLQINECCLHET